MLVLFITTIDLMAGIFSNNILSLICLSFQAPIRVVHSFAFKRAYVKTKFPMPSKENGLMPKEFIVVNIVDKYFFL